MYSRVELAALMTKKLGRDVIAREIPVDEWAKQVKIPPGELRDGLVAMNREYDRYGFSGGNSLVLETILGHKARTVINQLVKQFLWPLLLNLKLTKGFILPKHLEKDLICPFPKTAFIYRHH
jgi:hypothetical protein